MAVFASFDAIICKRTEAARLAMWVLSESMMVSAVSSSDTLSVAASPAKQLFEAYPLWVVVMTSDVRRR